jgi:Flp pilus assembly protein TadB
MPTDFMSPENFPTFLDQFTRSIHAVVSLTQSLETLQKEVRVHSENLAHLSNELTVVARQTQSIVTLVYGDGMSDSLMGSHIELRASIATITKKVDTLETQMQTQFKELREEEREQKRLTYPWKIAIWSMVISVLTMLANVFLSPIFNKIFK